MLGRPEVSEPASIIAHTARQAGETVGQLHFASLLAVVSERRTECARASAERLREARMLPRARSSGPFIRPCTSTGGPDGERALQFTPCGTCRR